MNQNRQVKRYLRQIQRLIPSDCIGKKDVLQTIRHRIDAYLSEHPDADMSEFMGEFGTPEELAESFLDEMSGVELMTDLNRRRCNTICTGGCLVLIAALFAAYALYIDYSTSVDVIESITIYKDLSEAPYELRLRAQNESDNKDEQKGDYDDAKQTGETLPQADQTADSF